MEALEPLEPLEPTSSWHMGMRVTHPDQVSPPDRRMHEKHLRKLNKFLLDVTRAPSTLTEDVRRKHVRDAELISL